MERVDANQKKQSIFASVWSWISSSPLRSVSIGTALAGIIAAAFLLQPSQEPQVAKIQPAPQIIEVPAVTLPKQESQELAVIKPHKAKAVKNSNMAVKTKNNPVLDAANKAGDFAALDAALTANASDDPVN
jgi:ABC-type uncharacterized transport system auxiliary subunit